MGGGRLEFGFDGGGEDGVEMRDSGRGDIGGTVGGKRSGGVDEPLRHRRQSVDRRFCRRQSEDQHLRRRRLGGWLLGQLSELLCSRIQLGRVSYAP